MANGAMHFLHVNARRLHSHLAGHSLFLSTPIDAGFMKTMNVLFVDDENFALHAIERFLAREPYSIFLAQNAQDALEILKNNSIDVIVSDMRMPGIDGLSLLVEVKKNYPDTIRLVLSGCIQTAQLLPCINRGEVYRFITKPFSPEELKSSIRDAVHLAASRREENSVNETLLRKNNELARALKDKEKTEEHLRALSVVDELTGVYNRRQFAVALNHEFYQSERYGADFSFLMIDLDHFKTVNDTFGHAFGDFVLKTFSSRTNEIIRETDLFFRYGGEEFAVLMPNTSIDDAMQLGNRILEMCRLNPYEQGKHHHLCTVSMGLVSYTTLQPNTPEVIVAEADRLLYIAKQNGRNQIVGLHSLSTSAEAAAIN